MKTLKLIATLTILGAFIISPKVATGEKATNIRRNTTSREASFKNKTVQSLPDRNYFFGQSHLPNKQGVTYHFFRKAGRDVVGISYSPPGESSCFKGKIYQNVIAERVVASTNGAGWEYESRESIDLSPYSRIKVENFPKNNVRLFQECLQVFSKKSQSLSNSHIKTRDKSIYYSPSKNEKLDSVAGININKVQYVRSEGKRDIKLEQALKKEGYCKSSTTSYPPHYSYNKFDLNNDGNPEAIVSVKSVAFCGTGGCPTLILSGQKNGYGTELFGGGLSFGRIIVTPHKTFGWNDLVWPVFNRDTRSVDYLINKFDGKKYNDERLSVVKRPSTITGRVFLVSSEEHLLCR